MAYRIFYGTRSCVGVRRNRRVHYAVLVVHWRTLLEDAWPVRWGLRIMMWSLLDDDGADATFGTWQRRSHPMTSRMTTRMWMNWTKRTILECPPDRDPRG